MAENYEKLYNIDEVNLGTPRGAYSGRVYLLDTIVGIKVYFNYCISKFYLKEVNKIYNNCCRIKICSLLDLNLSITKLVIININYLIASITCLASA